MDILIVAVVLASAFAHASWNVFIKMGGERLSSAALMFLFCALLSSFVVPFYPLPSAEVWPYILGSSLVHGVYVYCLAAAYEIGDFSKIYPIARGCAPLVSLLAAWVLIGETLSPVQLAAVVMVIAGVLGLSRSGKINSSQGLDRSALLAVVVAALIGGYTFLDGVGARIYGSAPGYIAWIFVVFGYCFALVVLGLRRFSFVSLARRSWKTGFAAASVSSGAYVAATWAMTQAPIGLVATLRETSVLFGLVLAKLVLQENFGWQRVIFTVVILSGVILLG